MALCYWVLLQPSLQGAEAVAVGVPGWQDPSHGALGWVHLLQNQGGVLLHLLHLLTDLGVISSWRSERKQSGHEGSCQSNYKPVWSALSNSRLKSCTVAFHQLLIKVYNTLAFIENLPRADLLEYLSETCFVLWRVASSKEGRSCLFTSSCN